MCSVTDKMERKYYVHSRHNKVLPCTKGDLSAIGDYDVNEAVQLAEANLNRWVLLTTRPRVPKKYGRIML